MLRYCVTFGALIGISVAILLLFLSAVSGEVLPMTYTIMGALEWLLKGLLMGLMAGLVVGFLSGLAMRRIAKQYGKPKSITEYRIYNGLAATGITILIIHPLLYLGLAFNDGGLLRANFLMAILFSISLVVYASQRTATKYLIDIDAYPQRVKSHGKASS